HCWFIMVSVLCRNDGNVSNLFICCKHFLPCMKCILFLDVIVIDNSFSSFLDWFSNSNDLKFIWKLLGVGGICTAASVSCANNNSSEGSHFINSLSSSSDS